MRSQPVGFIILFCLLQFACKRNKQQETDFDFKPPKVVEARSYKLPPEKMAPPKIIPASGVKKIAAGKPEIVQLKSNVFPAKAERLIQASNPTLIVPGEGGFILPRVVPAVDSPFAAGAPEIVMLKDLYIKESNPESFSSIKAMHGLNSNEISSLCQDKTGNLWIGEWWGGVSKYDGKFISNYSIPQGLSSDVVNCVLADRAGNIWIGTANGGLNKFDGRYITHYSTAEGLSSNFVWNMMQSKNGDMWFATDIGVNKYDGHSFTHYTTAQGLPADSARGLFEDSKGYLWFGCKGGLARFDGHSFQNYTSVFGIEPGIEVISILEDNEQNLWFATNKGLLMYDGRYISQFTTAGGLSSNRLSKITKDRNGELWIGTQDRGANKYDGKSFVHLGTEQGLSNEVVMSILPDKYGNIWMATTAGVCKYDGKLFNHIVTSQGLKQEEVECILADKSGNIWIGQGAGNNGVSKYDGKSIAHFTTKEGLVNTDINYIIEDRNGYIWFATRGNGVIKYDGYSFTNYSADNGLIENNVFCSMEDKKGNLWFGTQKGLSRFDGKYFTNYSIAQGLNGEPVYSLLQDHNGVLWIGTEDKGVCTFDGVSFTHYDLAHSLSHPMVIGMMEDKNNNIWFCTSMGVNKFDGKYFTWYTTEQGLSNNIAKNVLEDSKGNIWVGTINGMNRFVPHAISNFGSSLFKKYTVSEGFSGSGTYENSITKDSSGNIWIGGTDRVTRYHPEGDIPDTIPPTIQLSGVALFDENINWTSLEKKKDTTFLLSNGVKLKRFNFSGLTRWHNQPQNLELAYNNNYITFQFVGITTNRPKEIRYQYFLEGLDEHWSSITEQSEATYNNLPSGNYTFKVKAVNSEGYWSKELSYSVVIHPPWWHTWWAYSSYVLVFLTCVFLFTWYRSSRLKQENLILERKVSERSVELERSLEEKYELSKKIESQQALLNERLRISRELHDDIGSTLGSISIYSEVAKKRNAKNENANEVLSKIGLASRELIDKMSDIVWSLNPNNESFEQLQNRMMAFAAMMLAPRNIFYDFSGSEEIKTLHLTGEQRKNVFLIFKEALYNIVKYADCKNVHIVLTAQKKGLAMIIHDDGKGFDISKVTANNMPREGEYLGGNGIKNMQARADDMNAIIRIHSKINEGTTVQLKLGL